MTRSDYITIATAVALYTAGFGITAKILVNRFEREQVVQRMMVEEACERIDRKVDELEDFMAKKVEKIAIRHTEELNDLLEGKGL